MQTVTALPRLVRADWVISVSLVVEIVMAMEWTMLIEGMNKFGDIRAAESPVSTRAMNVCHPVPPRDSQQAAEASSPTPPPDQCGAESFALGDGSASASRPPAKPVLQAEPSI